jgi:hypothetical protein
MEDLGANKQTENRIDIESIFPIEYEKDTTLSTYESIKYHSTQLLSQYLPFLKLSKNPPNPKEPATKSFLNKILSIFLVSGLKLLFFMMGKRKIEYPKGRIIGGIKEMKKGKIPNQFFIHDSKKFSLS